MSKKNISLPYLSVAKDSTNTDISNLFSYTRFYQKNTRLNQDVNGGINTLLAEAYQTEIDFQSLIEANNRLYSKEYWELFDYFEYMD